MRRGWLIAAVLALVTGIVVPLAGAHAIPAAPPTVTIYAAPHGNGIACTADQPCSLHVAHLGARHFAQAGRANVDVVLASGTYQLTRPLHLTAADSGRNGMTVTYRAAVPGGAVLSGGRQLTSWQRVKGNSKVWQTRIPTTFDTRQLYVNGHRVHPAAGLPAGSLVQSPTGLITTSSKLAHWPHPTNIDVVFKGGNGPWTQTFCHIAAIHGHAITMAEPCFNNMHLKALGVQELAWFDDPMGGFGGLAAWKTPTKLENAYPLLSPNHWVIDRVAHKIYYEPTQGQSPTDQTVVVPALQTLLAMKGSPTNPVHNVVVNGLTFEYGAWTAPDRRDGFPQMQADWYLTGKNANNSQGTCQFSHPRGSCPFASWTRTPANVVLHGTQQVSMVGNTFTHLGGAGLDVYGGSRYDVVKGNSFTDISASGIQLGSTDDPLPGKYGVLENHNTVIDNYVDKVAIQYLGGIGIWLGYTAHSLIAHNQIAHLPYTGISIGWGGWHANMLNDNDPNLNAHNVVANNLIYDYMLQLGDGGAIYSNGGQASSWPTALKIHGNVAYNGVNTDFSIYTDAASKYVKIFKNFVYYQPFDSFNSGGCRTVGYIKIWDNAFAPGGPAYPCFAYTHVNHWNNTSVCENPPPSQTPTAIIAHAGLEPDYQYLARRTRPEVNLIGPTDIASKGDKVVISGSGFTPGTTVRFGGHDASKVKVLNANYLLVTAPAGNGRTNVTVTTAHGTSRITKSTQVDYSKNPPGCINGLGTGITTGLLF